VLHRRRSCWRAGSGVVIESDPGLAMSLNSQYTGRHRYRFEEPSLMEGSNEVWD
jgi:hypothetical protein